MSKNNIQYKVVEDKQKNSYVVITDITQEKTEEFCVPKEIENKRVIMLDDNSLHNLKAKIIVIPPAVVLGKTVFNQDLKTLFLSDGIIPTGIEQSLSSRKTEIFFPYKCPEYFQLKKLGFNVSYASLPLYPFMPETKQKKAYKIPLQEKEEEKDLTLAKNFFEKNKSKLISEDIKEDIDLPDQNTLQNNTIEKLDNFLMDGPESEIER